MFQSGTCTASLTTCSIGWLESQRGVSTTQALLGRRRADRIAQERGRPDDTGAARGGQGSSDLAVLAAQDSGSLRRRPRRAGRACNSFVRDDETPRGLPALPERLIANPKISRGRAGVTAAGPVVGLARGGWGFG